MRPLYLLFIFLLIVATEASDLGSESESDRSSSERSHDEWSESESQRPNFESAPTEGEESSEEESEQNNYAVLGGKEQGVLHDDRDHAQEADFNDEEQENQADAEEGIQKDILTRSGAHLTNEFIQRDELDNVIKLVRELSQSADSVGKMQSGALLGLGRSLRDDKTDFLNVFETLIKQNTTSEALSRMLQVSHMKLAFPALRERIIKMLTSIKDMTYFAQVNKALGDYFGWTITYYYFSGDNIPSSLSDEQLIVVRMMAAINVGDHREVDDVVNVVREAKTNATSVTAVEVTVQECLGELPKAPGMIRMLKSLSSIIEIQVPLLTELGIQYVEQMAVRKRVGLREAFREIEKSGILDEVKAAVLDHLAERNVSTVDNTVGFVKSMVHDDISPTLLLNYLIRLGRIPEELVGIGTNLSKVKSAQQFITILESIRHVAGFDYETMTAFVDGMDLDRCSQHLASLHFAIREGNEELVKGFLETLTGDIDHCLLTRLLEGIDFTLHFRMEESTRSGISKLLSSSPLFQDRGVKAIVSKRLSSLKKIAPALQYGKQGVKGPQKQAKDVINVKRPHRKAQTIPNILRKRLQQKKQKQSSYSERGTRHQKDVKSTPKNENIIRRLIGKVLPKGKRKQSPKKDSAWWEGKDEKDPSSSSTVAKQHRQKFKIID